MSLGGFQCKFFSRIFGSNEVLCQNSEIKNLESKGAQSEKGKWVEF
jgi:hypothetical protein